jgi:hypothetical protein
VNSGGQLSGDLRAFAASWNRQHFNQGAPKPDGSTPGITSGPSGTYDASTRRFTLTWTSQIVGGPFNNFTGAWHLTGTFVPKSSGTTTQGGNNTNGSPSTSTGTQAGLLSNTGPALPPLIPAVLAAGALVAFYVRRRLVMGRAHG